MKTAIEGMGTGTRLRRDGRIVALKNPPRARVDFGAGEKACIGVGWGDVSTAPPTNSAPGAFMGEARNAAGDVVRSRLRTPEGYTLTALTALRIAERTRQGEAKPGFQTLGGHFGGDFVVGFEGCEREDL